jgi:lipoprotein-anchoring transpeptidase ErfK/SrfK
LLSVCANQVTAPKAGTLPAGLLNTTVCAPRRSTLWAMGLTMRRSLALYAAAISAAILGSISSASAIMQLDPMTRQPLVVNRTTGLAASPIPREIIDYPGNHAAGTIIVNTPERRLYYIMGNGKALRYGIGVGREGFQWRGTHRVTMKREWPDWRPPAQMIKRQPDLPRYMPGGPANPLGARALYLGSTLFRIHGSNEPHTIGQAVSSGCFRMSNDDVADLYDRVNVGTKVVVMR